MVLEFTLVVPAGQVLTLPWLLPEPQIPPSHCTTGTPSYHCQKALECHRLIESSLTPTAMHRVPQAPCLIFNPQGPNHQFAFLNRATNSEQHSKTLHETLTDSGGLKGGDAGHLYAQISSDDSAVDAISQEHQVGPARGNSHNLIVHTGFDVNHEAAA